jgi:hypothetical protein
MYVHVGGVGRSEKIADVAVAKFADRLRPFA